MCIYRTADQIWNLYLGGSAGNRPFGSAKLDGVDFDLEKGDGRYVVDFLDRMSGRFAAALLLDHLSPSETL